MNRPRSQPQITTHHPITRAERAKLRAIRERAEHLIRTGTFQQAADDQTLHRLAYELRLMRNPVEEAA